MKYTYSIQKVKGRWAVVERCKIDGDNVSYAIIWSHVRKALVNEFRESMSVIDHYFVDRAFSIPADYQFK